MEDIVSFASSIAILCAWFDSTLVTCTFTNFKKASIRCIEDRFLAFSECLTGVTGSAIADHILRLLDEWQLSASNIRGQTYDGAGAMVGKSRGAAARIQAFQKAMYTHTVLRMPLTCVWSSAVRLLRSEIWTQLKAFVVSFPTL